MLEYDDFFEDIFLSFSKIKAMNSQIKQKEAKLMAVSGVVKRFA